MRQSESGLETRAVEMRCELRWAPRMEGGLLLGGAELAKHGLLVSCASSRDGAHGTPGRSWFDGEEVINIVGFVIE